MPPLHRLEGGGDSDGVGEIDEGTPVGARGRGGLVAGHRGVATATVGLGLPGAAAGDSSDQFENLKPIKAPSPCKNDPGVTDTEIKIGTIVPTSGPVRGLLGRILDGIKARVAKANAEGELGNRKITLVNVDDGGDAARNVTAAQQLVEQDKVFADHPRERRRRRQRRVPERPEGVPVVGWQLGLPVYGTYPNFFGFQNANAKDIKTNYTTRNAEVVKALGGKKIAVIGNTTATAAIFTEQVADGGEARRKGMKTVYKNHDIPVGHHRVRRGRRADQGVGRRLRCTPRCDNDGEHRPHAAR